MFVPTHTINDLVCQLIYYPSFFFTKDQWNNDQVFVMTNDGLFRTWRFHYDNNAKPITLTCPYCHATINQQERVECECGWCAEAITEKQFNLIMGASQELIDLGSKQYLLPRYVNNIHWLELTPGKEKK